MGKRLTVSSSEFRAKCLQLMSFVDALRIEVEVTKRGRPIARLVPIEKRTAHFGCLKGSVTYHASVIEPTVVEWEVNT